MNKKIFNSPKLNYPGTPQLVLGGTKNLMRKICTR